MNARWWDRLFCALGLHQDAPMGGRTSASGMVTVRCELCGAEDIAPGGTR